MEERRFYVGRAHDWSATQMAWEGMLMKPGVRLVLITDPAGYPRIESAVSGVLGRISKLHVSANNAKVVI